MVVKAFVLVLFGAGAITAIPTPLFTLKTIPRHQLFTIDNIGAVNSAQIRTISVTPPAPIVLPVIVVDSTDVVKILFGQQPNLLFFTPMRRLRLIMVSTHGRCQAKTFYGIGKFATC